LINIFRIRFVVLVSWILCVFAFGEEDGQPGISGVSTKSETFVRKAEDRVEAGSANFSISFSRKGALTGWDANGHSLLRENGNGAVWHLNESVEPEPLEDTGIDVGPAALATGRRWRPRRPTTSARSSTTVLLNHVARERANTSHQMLEQLLADAARANGHAPQCNAHIDMYFGTGSGTVLAEMKSCHQNNLHNQVRRGVSQLLEYRFVYRDVLATPVTLTLIIETPPSSLKRWLVECLESLGILLAWKEPRANRIVATTTIPPSLSGVVLPSS